MSDRATGFRQKAAECSLKASKICDEAESAAWLLVANAWLTLARSDEQRADSIRALDQAQAPSALADARAGGAARAGIACGPVSLEQKDR
jgi:hypothetical protein